MYRYKLHTEKMNQEFLISYFSKYFDGFSVYELTGYWKKVPEQSLCFELIHESDDMLCVFEAIAKYIKHVNKQESVLITREKINAEFV